MKMKPLFCVIILIFMLFLTEIETAGKKQKQIKTRPAASEPDERRHGDDDKTILNSATPARRRKHQRWAGFEFGKYFDPTGEKAQHMFVDHYQNIGLPNSPDATLELYDRRHNCRGNYYLPEKPTSLCLSDRYDELQKQHNDPLVEPHHQEMYEHHQAFQDGSSFRGKLLKIKAGTFNLPEEKGGSTTHRFEEARKRAKEPLAQQDNQQLYQQHQDFQDHSAGPGSSSRRKLKGENTQNMFVDHYQERNLHNVPDATLKLNTQHHAGGSYEQHMYQQHQAFQDQFGGSGSGSGYNHPYTAPPMSPAEDIYGHFDIQHPVDMHPLFYIPPPADLDFEENRLQNNPSAAALIDNHYIHLKHQYGDRSRVTGSG